MGGVADLAVRVSAEVGNFEKNVDSAVKKLGEVSKGMKKVGKNLSLMVTAPITAAGVMAFKAAANLEDAMGATDQIFKGASGSIKGWAKNLEGYYGIAEGEALEHANMMGSMLQNIGGLTEDEAATQAQALIELAGDLTAMYGGTTADAVRALTGALKGNNTMLDNYGMAANDAMIKTKAMEMGLLKEGGQLDLAAKQAATLSLVMEQTGAAQGQAAREADGASGTMRTLITELKNVAAELGQVLLPILTPLIGKIKGVVQWFSNLSPAGQKTIVVLAGIAAAIGPVLTIIGTFISIVKGLIALKKVWTAVQGALNIVLNANPIGLVVIAIAALIAIIVLVIKYWDEIVVVLKAGWDWISGVFQKGWEAFADFWSGIWDGIKETAEGVWQGIIDFFDGAKQKIVDIFENIKEGIVGIWQGIWDGIKGFINKIIGGMNSMIGGLNKLKFDIPDWVPLIGGKTWGLNIPKIPTLDTGGLVKGPGIFHVGAGVTEVVRRYDPAENVARSGGRQTVDLNLNVNINGHGLTEADKMSLKPALIQALTDPDFRRKLDGAMRLSQSDQLRPQGAF